MVVGGSSDLLLWGSGKRDNRQEGVEPGEKGGEEGEELTAKPVQPVARSERAQAAGFDSGGARVK